MAQPAVDYEDTPEFALYARLREQGSVFRRNDDEPWIVLGFSECDYVLRNEDVFAHPNRRDLMTEQQWSDAVETVGGRRALVLLQADQHKRMHKEIQQRLSRNMERYRTERIRPVVDRALDAFVSAGGGDFASAAADPLPPTIIASVLGLAWEDDEMVRAWKRLDEQVLRSRMDFVTPEQALDDARTAAGELNVMLRRVVRDRRNERRDDFISQLWDFVPQILSDCDEDDIIAQCRQIFAGGSESTSHLLCNAGLLLFTRPDLWAELKADPNRTERFIEETLRVMNVIHERPRIAVEDVKLGGQWIRTGDRLFVMLPAANRDAHRPGCTARFDLNAPPTRHIAFGSGPRICAGAAFARAEAREVIRGLLTRVDAPALDPDQPPPVWVCSNALGSWRPLNVRI